MQLYLEDMTASCTIFAEGGFTCSRVFVRPFPQLMPCCRRLRRRIHTLTKARDVVYCGGDMLESRRLRDWQNEAFFIVLFCHAKNPPVAGSGGFLV